MEEGQVHRLACSLIGAAFTHRRTREVRHRLGHAEVHEPDAHTGRKQHGEPRPRAELWPTVVRPQPDLAVAGEQESYRKDQEKAHADNVEPAEVRCDKALNGDRIYGWIGNLVDILAVFGTLFGLATSLGLGAQQVNSGLNTLFGIPVNTVVQMILIAIITGVAAVSVVLGIDKGIRNLALINMWLAIGLALFVFLVGPTLFILNSLASDFGYYLQNLIGTSFNMYTGSEAGAEWQAGWTLFYWGWWISWSPFVGMFIARISRGRTLREFIGGVLFAPVGASAVWFVIFGETAINYLRAGTAGGLADADSSNALFVLLQALPVASILSVIASVVGIIVVVLFFATSSDSGSLVIDILTNGGDPDPRWYQRLFWAILEGVVAAVLLAVGGLTALQTASITAGLPFSIVLLFMCIGLYKGLQDERLPSMTPDPARDGAPEVGRARSRKGGATAPQQMSGPEREDRR